MNLKTTLSLEKIATGFFMFDYANKMWCEDYTCSRLHDFANSASDHTDWYQLAEYMFRVCMGYELGEGEDEEPQFISVEEFEICLRRTISWYENTGEMEVGSMLRLLEFHKNFILARMDWSV